ncbi:cytochrome P450 [Infundibulicybe gibba]|nr:cytochrome P450 [Infundibulicybe gibba]
MDRNISKSAGDILHAEALGQHIIILNLLEAATDIMERRAAKYSSRPSILMLELMDWIDFNASLLPYGDLWRHHRRVFQQSFRKDAAALYEPIQRKKTHKMLRDLLESLNDFRAHIRTTAAGIIMAIVYGHNISTMNDNYILIAEKAAGVAVEALLPGASLVNVIPALRYIPPWFPGAKFHQVAGEVRELTYQMRNAGFDFVRKNMRDGIGEPSLLGSLLEANDVNGGSTEYENILKGVSTIAYAAGADTRIQEIWLGIQTQSDRNQTSIHNALASRVPKADQSLARSDRRLGAVTSDPDQ